jgi:hypothetical protein
MTGKLCRLICIFMLLTGVNDVFAECGRGRHPVTTWPVETCADDDQFLPSTITDCNGDLCQAGSVMTEETKRAINNLAIELQKTPEAIQVCINNVPQCATEILSAPLAAHVQAYIEGLYRQSEGRTYSFSHEFIALAQPYFSVDLKGITWANDINTGTGGMSVSYCDRIFFAGNGDLWRDRNELHLVLHELEHTVQCQARGKRTYLAEYVLKAGLDVIKNGTFNVHDIHDYEVAADKKADQVTGIIWNKIQSGTVSIPVSVTASDGNIIPPPRITGGNQSITQTMVPVRFCKTQMGTCQIPPAMVPMGSPCFCNGPYGQVLPGAAY